MKAHVAIFVALTLSACRGPTVHMWPIEASSRPDQGRPETQVDVYLNAPPARPFAMRYLIDRAPEPKDATAMFARARESAAAVGCDGVLVYTREHPAWKAGPQAEDEALVLSTSGLLSSEKAGVTVPDRLAVLVKGPSKTHILSDTRFVAVCIDYQ